MSRQKEEWAALYERLSKDDELAGDSNSIVHQMQMLEGHAALLGYAKFKHYTDDGYSGGTFNRPGWNQMIQDIHDGKVVCVIAKDMSRVGRDYLQVGFYTDVLFREKGVRFVAVGNGIDSNVKGSNDFAPFLNIMNEWMLRDTSQKIQAVLRSRGLAGKHTGSHALYGYKKDPENPDHWIIDEEVADVVRRIYQLVIDGYGPFAIARKLTEDKIERPSYYLGKQGLGTHQQDYNADDPYTWGATTVTRILCREEYKGWLVNFRSRKESYKDKKGKPVPKDEQVIIKDAHEAIIDEETWELVQTLKTTRRRYDTTGEANPLTGLMFCADCGAKMYNHRHWSDYVKKDGTRTLYDSYDCSNYKIGQNHFEKRCCSHKIQTYAVQKIVLEAIRLSSEEARRNPEQFIKAAQERATAQMSKDADELRKRVKKHRKRLSELENLVRKLYESFATGLMSEKNFTLLIEGYQREQEELEEVVEAEEQELAEYEEDTGHAEQFVAIAKKYTDLSELTPEILNEFIEKILVHKPEKINGQRTQEIEVYLKFVGRFDFPEDYAPQPTPDEIEKERIRKEKHREACRKYMRRIRAEQKNKDVAEEDK